MNGKSRRADARNPTRARRGARAVRPCTRPWVVPAVVGLSCAAWPAIGPSAAAQEAPVLAVRPYEFETRSGEVVAAELGSFEVPENRADPDSRRITLKFVRFESTAEDPGPPIVYLAGGPGGSGVEAARGDRFPLFMTLRSVADVIAFDQRATGMSEPDLSCPGSYEYPLDRPGEREAWLALAREAARRCLTAIIDRGVDPLGYTTRESAEDLESLRLALGVERISLWGISYGTHLGLEMIRRHPRGVDRAVLAGVEGPDHTFILPAAQQEHLEFLAALARKHPVREHVPDLEATVAGVLERLEREPVGVEVPRDDGPPRRVVLGRFDAQLRTAMAFFSRSWDVPRIYHEMAAGDFSFLAGFMADYRRFQGVGALGLLMSCSSWATPERLAAIESQRSETLLGAARAFPYPDICEVVHEIVPGLDLGPEFRSPIRSEVPALFISGTMDGVTPLSNAVDVARGFENGRHLLIHGAAHSDALFLSHAEIGIRIRDFLAGEEPESGSLAVPFDFAVPGGSDGARR